MVVAIGVSVFCLLPASLRSLHKAAPDHVRQAVGPMQEHAHRRGACADTAMRHTGDREQLDKNEPALTMKRSSKPELTAVRAQDESSVDQERSSAAVHAWETLVDEVVGMEGQAAFNQRKRVKEAFDHLGVLEQRESISLALNLFTDDQFPALYGILFDGREDSEVLDAIFSDALNRADELKQALLAQLAKDKGHPCFMESARILDAMKIGI